MSWLKALRNKAKDTQKQYAPPVGPPPGVDLAPPPEWQPAPERRHTLGLYAEATEDEWESAQRFCAEYPPEPPRLLPSDVVEHIDAAGCRAWQIEQPRTPRFKGRIYNAGGNLKGSGGMDVVRVVTEVPCEDVCLMSDLPILAGLYDIHGKLGVYYEVKVLRMDGLIAVGMFSIEFHLTYITMNDLPCTQALHVDRTPSGGFPAGTVSVRGCT